MDLESAVGDIARRHQYWCGAYDGDGDAFQRIPMEILREALETAERLMLDAGMWVHPHWRRVPVAAWRVGAHAEEAQIGRSRGVYYVGTILLADRAGADTLVHECAHHIQGVALLDLMDPWFKVQAKRTPYRRRWYEQDAFMVQKAFLTGWAADSCLVSFWNWNQKRIWDK